MNARFVISDGDVLSAIAHAEEHGLQSRLEHLPMLFGPRVLVPKDVLLEMQGAPKSEATRRFGNQLHAGFEEMNPQRIDPGIHRPFPLEPGEAACVSLAEELARSGHSVLILVNEKKACESVRQRAKKFGFDISTARTADILCHSAERGLIRDLVMEASRFHEMNICRFSADQHQKFRELQNFIRQQEQLQPSHLQTLKELKREK